MGKWDLLMALATRSPKVFFSERKASMEATSFGAPLKCLPVNSAVM